MPSHHDAAFGQGPGIRNRLPARLGGRPVPAPARARRRRPLGPGGRTPPRLCRPDARQEEPATSGSSPTAASMASGNRRIPSRFLDELPEAHVEVAETGNSYGGYGGQAAAAATASRASTSAGTRSTTPIPPPAGNAPRPTTHRRHPRQLGLPLRRIRSSASATAKRIRLGAGRFGQGPHHRWRTRGEIRQRTPSNFIVGDRVFHINSAMAMFPSIEGNKLTIDFDKAGQKRVLDGFVSGV